MRIEERPTRLGGVAGVRVDVTDLVQREQQLEQLNARLAESRAQLHAVIGTAQSAILTLDEQGVVLSANPATATIFGWPEAELVGRDIGCSCRASPAPRRAPAAAAPQDIRARHRDGHSIAVQLSLSRLDSAGGARFVAMFTDLSDRGPMRGRCATPTRSSRTSRRPTR